MTGIEAPCPLCGEVFTDDAAYADHLATVHGLVDDEGAETTVEHALVVSGVAGDLAIAAEAAVAAEAASIIPGITTDADEVHPSRVYDPADDDVRWRPFVLGLTGLILIVAVGLGLSGLGGDDDGPTEVAALDPTTTTAAPDPVAAGPPADAAAVTVDTVPAEASTETTVPATATPTTRRPVTTDVAPTTPPATTPPPTAPPTTAPPTTAPPTTAPPTTARPTYVAPSLSGARIDGCQRHGQDRTWTFSYVLSGGANWAPAPGAQSVGGGRYRETRTSRGSNSFPSSSIQVVDTTTGQNRSITLSPQLAGTPC